MGHGRTIRRPDATVACGSCRTCCTGTNVALFEGDDLALYEHKIRLSEVDPENDAFYRAYDAAYTGFVLKRDAENTCVYMRATGCSIYEMRPIACRSFSCVDVVRRIAAMSPEDQAAHHEITASQIFREGQARSAP